MAYCDQDEMINECLSSCGVEKAVKVEKKKEFVVIVRMEMVDLPW